jgi:hypothetical protein
MITCGVINQLFLLTLDSHPSDATILGKVNDPIHFESKLIYKVTMARHDVSDLLLGALKLFSIVYLLQAYSILPHGFALGVELAVFFKKEVIILVFNTV